MARAVWASRTACAALAALGALAAAGPARSGEAGALQLELGAALGQRTLTEHDAAGARLLRESGPLARLRAAARPAAPWSGLDVNAALTLAPLDYQGQTQSGAALSTDSRHRDLELGVGWRPLPASAWGEPALTLSWLDSRRAIAGTSQVGGLTETSSLWLPGLAWRSPVLALAFGRASMQLSWRASIAQRLQVDYGGAFDASSFTGGRREEVLLRLGLASSDAWRWALEWSRTRQAASAPATLYRNAVAVGTVRQPQLRIDDLSLSLTRIF
ncbi:hypothetical protein GCM10027034_45690 [Ramlibacter solisilvae]|uniref:YaiO family outer membrane beta-barrel protein n=1 Tax=Ramlibacter tataouinensis TaxID=94132 RepID=A0A127JSN1_9BURK|nr:hypothetical protein [Ramlibacter tataouinensis]AMO23008.1 hypothetical protein UC35_09045 [Ramlibacter tataouinensis]